MKVTVNWVSEERPLALEDELMSFRDLFPEVTFTRDPAYVPGPGSDQRPAVIIESADLSEFQAAVREFAFGPAVREFVSNLKEVDEHWKYNTQTGELLAAEFEWMTADGQLFGVDVVPD